MKSTIICCFSLLVVWQECVAWDPMTATPMLRASVGPFPENGSKDIEISSLVVTRSGYLLMGNSAHGGDLKMVPLNDPHNIQTRSQGRAHGVASMALLSDDQVALTTTNVNRLYIFNVSDGVLGWYEDMNLLDYDHHYHAVTDGPNGNVVVAGGGWRGASGYVDIVTRKGKLVRNLVSNLTDFDPEQMTSFGGDVYVSSSYSSEPGLLGFNVESGEVIESIGAFNFSDDQRDLFDPYTSTFGQGAFDGAGNLYIAAFSASCRANGEKTNFCVLLITPEGETRRLISGTKWVKKAMAVALTPTGLAVAWRIDIRGRMHAAVELYDMVD
ncbi:uncharacterized protein [Littorina saxatilis]|uniref:SMP-30/Gluconolactonase/LRE-like region domain-containing protein n=1 Tax=Littorina saxatilis TaxID=31220 RepID=A0AAN9AIK1_9CAEN